MLAHQLLIQLLDPSRGSSEACSIIMELTRACVNTASTMFIIWIATFKV